LTEAALCTSVSLVAGEPQLATASRVRNWLLVEQPGPWGRDALLDSRLDRELGTELAVRARAARVRVLLIRRPGRAEPGPRRCFVAHTGRTVRWVEQRILDQLDELLTLDLAALHGGERPGFGEPFTRPLHLVCTNGRHDRCCATFGRPLAQELAGTLGESVWECSHIGGDRFAANLVCFPHGLYFGRVEPAGGARVATLYEAGQIDLDHYRGRSCYEPAVQAAEHFLRERQGIAGVDELLLEGRGQEADEVVARWADTSGARWLVRVRVVPAETARPLTCAGKLAHPPTYLLTGLESMRVS
jgi:hypothetical protein